MKDKSNARRVLARLTEEFGTDGTLIVPKPNPGVRAAEGAEGADLIPGSALRWPRCECGNSVCPDYEAPRDRP
ncbi:hypothetical protein [Streptomyces liangshanensis]|uniref:Uncharacterized protein n=1 Tax=Streptomyces liangshanensis TaxID=2717324 RepID=A0A6G9H315_9ACTN|nr:hypothetical protein [Streptomyces liangshanensis]QIQ04923.1 hypothetical protein HA039_23925 [Streptomyces liangshanensis]